MNKKDVLKLSDCSNATIGYVSLQDGYAIGYFGKQNRKRETNE